MYPDALKIRADPIGLLDGTMGLHSSIHVRYP